MTSEFRTTRAFADDKGNTITIPKNNTIITNPMKIEDMTPMKATEAEKEEGYINPFLQDSFHMGTRLGKNVIIMHRNFDSDDASYLIVINTKTGERKRITF